MGAWGTELYASDFGQDMRDSVKAVARLPFEPARLLDYLCATEPRAANDSQDPDHAVFWLTVADQFNKRGIDCTDARDRALAIIAKGSDLAAMARLGMDEKSLAKRGAMLQELRARLGAPIAATKLRSVLKGPQKLLLEPGEVVIYPVCQGDPIIYSRQGLRLREGVAGWFRRLHGRRARSRLRSPRLVPPPGDLRALGRGASPL